MFRQLDQDVRGFWQFLDRQARAAPEERWRLAEAMVGRARSGTPLVPLSHDPIAGVGPAVEDVALNHFTYASDPDGIRCPLGAHVRRANPRTGDLPAGTRSPIARLLRMLGFKRASFRDDLVAATRFHRLLRRGREYGTALSPEDALRPAAEDQERGLHFICLVANLSRQFEFVQNAWLQSTKFAGLSDEADPLLGSRAPIAGFADAATSRPTFAGLSEEEDPRLAGRVALAGTPATGVFSIPLPGAPARRIAGLPQFVTVKGGAYFFLPGLRALRYIAGAPPSAPLAAPAPPAPSLGRWHAPLLALHRALQRGLHFERRLEPFFRPAFNRALREPLAGLIQHLINRRRPNEGLQLAEERIAPDEEDSLELIVASFGGYMLRTYRPGLFERGGNTKTHGIVKALVTIRDDLPAHLRHGIFKEPRTFPAYVRYSGPGPNLPNDIEDVGFVSMAIKVMDVPGPKLLDDEKHTQDLLAVCTPTFVTPNTRENAKLQVWSFRDMPVFYFLNPLDPHLLDFLMQSLWNETQYNPLGARYWSCVPYLLGAGQAMMYSFLPRSKVITDIPGVPFGPRAAELPARQHGRDARPAGRRVRPPGPGPDRPASDADRERVGPLARERVAVRAGGDRPHPTPEVRHPGPCRARPAALDQPLALPARAPPARQPEPRPPAHLPGALPPSPAHEPDAARRADRQRGARVTRSLQRARRRQAKVRPAASSTAAAPAASIEGR